MKKYFFLLGYSVFVFANPQNMAVVAGEAQLDANGALLNVSVSDRAILNWDSFSIQPNEVTRFIQPSEQSAVLNRVVGAEMSQLMGLLQSNGQVYLINPNGVVIGKEGRVDTAGFVAAALEIRPEEFLQKGAMRLLGDAQSSVINLGTIHTSSGPIAMVAHRVENHGIIEAEKGAVSLASGHEILLQPSGNSLLFIRPDLPSGGVDQTGTIRALEAQIQADGAIAMAIHMGGEIQASAVVQEGGRFYLRAPDGGVDFDGTISAPEGNITIEAGTELHVRGMLDVAGNSGGTVDLIAEEIYLDCGLIDASGDTRSGQITIGKTDSRVARTTHVAECFSLLANANSSGDGGRIGVFADKKVDYFGQISAQSLGSFGSGGNVEISAKSLHAIGFADVRSANGLPGFVLHDPLTVTIIPGADTPPVADTYTDGYISNQLNMGNFSISTAPDAGVFTFSGGINISWAQPTTFQLIGLQILNSGGAVTIQNTSNSTSSFYAVDFRANIGPGIPAGSGTFQGITFTDTTIDASMGAGIISLAGQGGTTASGNTAIVLDHSSITTLSGTISVAGFFFTNVGAIAPSDVHLQNGTHLTSTSGQVTVAAQQGNIVIDGTSTISDSTGDILINAGSSFSGASGSDIHSTSGTVTIHVLKLLNPPPTTSATIPDIASIIAIAATQAGQYPLQLTPQSLTNIIYYGASNQSPRVGCVTAPVAIAGAP